MSAPVTVHAFVLHSRPYRESSALLELLTAEQGRVGAVLRGVRGSRRSATPAVFQPQLMTLAGQGELRQMRQAEAVGVPLQLGGMALFSGLYLNELLVRLLGRDEPVPELFAGYGQALARLAETTDIEPVLRQFEWQVLEALGVAPELAVDCDRGLPLLAEASYRLWPERGVSPTRERAGAGLVFTGAELMAMAAGDWARNDDVRRAAKRALRALLAGPLGPRPLKSRELFLQLKP